jgi:D-serine deaminase-like pyridoxal phosphate-dependent protein
VVLLVKWILIPNIYALLVVNPAWNVHYIYAEDSGSWISQLQSDSPEEYKVALKQSTATQLPPEARYRVTGAEAVLTPALLIYRDLVEANIRNTIRLLGNDVGRWRPHVKTAKLAFIIKLMIQNGVRQFKCATSLELQTLCECGATDVLLSFTALGPGAARVREIADQYRNVAISALADDEKHLEAWSGSRVGLFVDINPGMDRTGIKLSDPARITQLVRTIEKSSISFRGLHCYEGQLSAFQISKRVALAHRIYDQLLALLRDLKRQGINVLELVTTGTPTFPCALSYKEFSSCGTLHRVSPGTVVYCDSSSIAQLPLHYGYCPAAVVLARVVSRPSATVVTCDAGHKSMSVDRGVPNCVVLGYPNARPLAPSEEHLPIQIAGASLPALGALVYLVPRHICPTVNNFGHALILSDGRILELQRVSARGREAPLLISEPGNLSGHKST